MAGIVSQLIDSVVFTQLQQYEDSLKSCVEVTNTLLGDTSKLVAEFEKLNSLKDVTAAFEKLASVEERLDAVEKQRVTTTSQLINEEKRLTDAKNRATGSAKNFEAAQRKVSAAQATAAKTTKDLIDADKRAEQTTDEYTESLKEAADAIGVTEESLRDFAQSIADSEEAQKQLAQTQQQVESGTIKLALSYSEEAKQLAMVRVAQQQRNQELRNQVKLEQAEEGSLAAMRGQLNLLTQQYDNLGKASRESAQGKELLTQVKALSDELKILERETGRAQRGVGEYERGQSKLGTVLGINIGKLLSYGAALKAVSLAKDAWVKATQATATSADAFAVKLEGMKEGINYFWRALSSGGSFDGFLTGIRNAIRAGEEYRTVMNEIEHRTRALVVAEAASRKEVAALRAQAADTGQSRDVRLEALEKAMKAEKDLLDLRLSNLKDIEAAEVKRASETRGINAEVLKDYINQYHTRKDEIAALQEIVSLQNKIKNAGRNVTLDDGGRVVTITEEIKAYEAQLANLRKVNASITDENIKDWRKYGLFTSEVLDNIAKAEADVFNAQAQYDEETRRMVTQIAALRKELADEDLKSERARIDLINLRLQNEANAAKKAADDDERSLEERLANYRIYQQKISQITVNIGGIDKKEAVQAQKSADEIELISAKMQSDLNAIQLEGLEFRRAQEKRIAGDMVKAQQALQDLQLSEALAALRRVADDEASTYEQRLAASDSFYEARKEALRNTLSYRLQVERLNNDDIILAEAQMNAAIEELDRESAKNREDIAKSETDKFVEQINRRLDAQYATLDRDQSVAVADTTEAYARGELNEREYQDKLFAIDLEYADKRAGLQLGMLKETLANFKGTAEERKKLEEEIALAEIDLEKHAADTRTKIAQKGAKERIEIEKAYKEAVKQTLTGVASAFNEITKQNSQRRQVELDADLAAVQAKLDADQERLDNATMTDERRAQEQAILDEKRAAKEEEINQKKKAEELKQAQFEKQWAIAQATLNTVASITKTAASLPFPLNIPLVALAAAQGAAQIAVAKNIPLPKYAQGVLNAPGGWALTGDAYRHEVYESPSGKTSITPARPTLTYIEKGANVYKDIPTYMKSQFDDLKGSALDLRQPFVGSDGISDRQVNRIVNAVKSNRPTMSLNVGRHSFGLMFEHGRRIDAIGNELYFRR